MSAHEEARRSGEATGSKASAHQPNASKATRSKLSQLERVRRMLERGWCCGTFFLDPADRLGPILRYSAHIHSLRREGVQVDRRPCQHPHHNHHTVMYEWRINLGGTLPGMDR